MRKNLIKGIAISLFIFIFSFQYVFAEEKSEIKEYSFSSELTDEEVRQSIYDKLGNDYEIVSIEIEHSKRDTKEFEKIEKKSVDASGNALSYFEKQIEYQEDGYKGILYRVDATLTLVPNAEGTETFEVNRTYKKTYSLLPNNDVANIPKEINESGYSMRLTGLKFVIVGYEVISNSQVPNLYDAIATYTYTAKEQRQVVKSYEASVLYRNTLEFYVDNKVLVEVKKIESERKEENKVKEVAKIEVEKVEYPEEVPKESIQEETSEVKKEKNPFVSLKLFLSILNFIKICFLIILMVIFIILTVSLLIYITYIFKYKIKLYNLFNQEYIFLNRTKILKDKEEDNLIIDLTPFYKNIKSLLFKIEIPNQIAKKYDGKEICVVIEKDKKRYVRTILVARDLSAKTTNIYLDF